MHELSIALSMLEIATTAAEAEKASRINEIEVEIGSFAGIQIDALTFCFDTAKEGTLAWDASLRIISIPAKGKCLDCTTEFPMEFLFSRCPECDSVRVRLLHGKNLNIRAINID